MWKRICKKIIGQSRVYAVYTTSDRQAGELQNDIQVYDAANPPLEMIEAFFRREAGRLGAAVLRSRLRNHGAVLLILLDGAQVAAYGWLQTWSLLRREFWWLADDAICLGPYWTHPDQRGKGLYGTMLRHSLAECERRFHGKKDIYIWADARNAPSRRGIERAGFRSVGLHRVSIYLGGTIRRHREEPNEPSTNAS